MKKHEARTVIDQALDELAKALQEGKSEQLTTFLAAMARFHRYSLQNTMLILLQRPTATHVAGFNTWKSLGRHVNKGEKGILIIAPMRCRNRDEAADTAQRDGRETDTDRLLFRAVYVFDITQTEGDPLPELDRVKGDPGPYTKRLRTHIAERGIVIEETDRLGSADGASTGGRIFIKPGLSPAEEFSVLVHELAHEMLHHGDGRSTTTKAVRETEAEASAFIVSTAIGLQPKTASADYIHLHQGDVKLLTASLEAIQRVAGEILDALLAPATEEEPAACSFD